MGWRTEAGWRAAVTTTVDDELISASAPLCTLESLCSSREPTSKVAKTLFAAEEADCRRALSANE